MVAVAVVFVVVVVELNLELNVYCFDALGFCLLCVEVLHVRPSQHY